jgi:ubiquitin-conjugating enzyme E2 O
VEKPGDDWTLAERTLMRGDIVVHAEDPNGQMGTVVEVYGFADIGHVYGENEPTYTSVPTNMLYPASDWRFELLVAKNGWIGSVTQIMWKYKVQLLDSETILTLDSLQHDAKPIARLQPTVLPACPSSSTHFVGTYVLVATSWTPLHTQGDQEWREAIKSRQLPHPKLPEEIASMETTDAWGLITESEISHVIVSWADHALGGNVGTTQPHNLQHISSITVVDPFFHNSFSRYELTWLTPDIKKDYLNKQLYEFPDGTKIDRQTTETYSPSEPYVRESTYPMIQWNKHPDPSKASTMTGTYERVLSYNDQRRRESLNAPHVRAGSTYKTEDLMYIKAITRFIDVQWQDGSITRKESSIDLLPYLHLADTDFQPNDIIQSVPTTVEESEVTRRGVVQSVDHKNRVATVWWIAENNIEPHVSVYMLDDSDSRYHYRIGYFCRRGLHESEKGFDGTVGLVDNLDDQGRIYVLWAEGGAGWYYPLQVIAFDASDYGTDTWDGLNPRASPEPTGDLIAFRRPPRQNQDEESEAEAEIGDDITKLPVEELYELARGPVDEDAEDAGSASGSEQSDVDDEDQSGSHSASSDIDGDVDDDGIDAIEEDIPPLEEDSDLVLSASPELQTATTLAATILDDSTTMETSSSSSTTASPQVQLKIASNSHGDFTRSIAPQHPIDLSSSSKNTEAHIAPSAPLVKQLSSLDLNPSAADSDIDEDLLPFRFAESVPKDHHYAKHKQISIANLPNLAMKEWKLLGEATLDGAYVIAYEDRVDLFRFIVCGAHGTPFYLSWFMFDLKFDSDYPSQPPHVFYRSLGPKLHPNLYEDGNVCLSLLGTWSGSGVEVWDPASSNTLQVVLSIQGLILGVKEPYYLEAGYDKHRGTPEGEANSLVYNERSFLLSVQQMKKLIEHPPPEFGKLIHNSFRKHKDVILDLEKTLSLDPEVLATVDMTMFGLPKGAPSIGFRAAFKSIFPSVKKVLLSL